MSRLEFSRKTRREVLDRAQGHCEACGGVLKAGEGDIDHILPAALGGLPTLSNAQVLCHVCHRGTKTPDDVRRIRKADRQRDKASGAMKSTGRGFYRPSGSTFDWRSGRYVRRTP